MIRINLLERTGGKGTPPASDTDRRVTLVGGVILAVTVMAIGGRVWSLRQETHDLDLEVAAATQELARLGPVVERVDALNARRVALESRVEIIEELRRGQDAPMRLLEELSRSLPDGVWLSRLEHDDATVGVEGRALNLAALSDFMANLESTGSFVPPVEIVDSQTEEVGQTDVVRFELRSLLRRPDS